jgi:hypothetical protein
MGPFSVGKMMISPWMDWAPLFSDKFIYEIQQIQLFVVSPRNTGRKIVNIDHEMQSANPKYDSFRW